MPSVLVLNNLLENIATFCACNTKLNSKNQLHTLSKKSFFSSENARERREGDKKKIMEFTYKMQYKFDAVEEGEMNCKQGQLVTSDSECLVYFLFFFLSCRKRKMYFFSFFSSSPAQTKTKQKQKTTNTLLFSLYLYNFCCGCFPLLQRMPTKVTMVGILLLINLIPTPLALYLVII